MNKRNVFSEQSESITMLVYTQSFLSEKSAFQYFNNANSLETIIIYYMPLLAQSDISLQIETGSYIHTPKGNTICTTIKFCDISKDVYLAANAPQRKTDDELSKKTEEILLRNQLGPRLFDYVVASDEWCKKHKEFDSVLPYSEAKEILRLFLIKNKKFEVINNYFCDEFSYYIYRHKVLFQEYQNFWSSTIQKKNETDIDTASALGNRLLLFSICIDNLSIEAYKIQNNTTAMHLLYHMSFLLLLITGTFDSLAWIINNLYGLGFEEKKRHQIDLINKDFRKAVKQKSPLLHSILSGISFINKVEAIRELRDRIVHRNYINTISSGDKDNRKNYLWIDQTASDKLIKAGFDEKNYFMKHEDFNAIDILGFLRYLKMTTINIVDCFLKCISNEIYHTADIYSIWEMLRFPAEPFVL